MKHLDTGRMGHHQAIAQAEESRRQWIQERWQRRL